MLLFCEITSAAGLITNFAVPITKFSTLITAVLTLQLLCGSILYTSEVITMYTEIVKIIEGGLVNDKEKVINYAEVLATNLERQGEVALAGRIRRTLSQKRGTFTSLDSFSTKPVDIESRMDIVDITMPQVSAGDVILDQYSRNAIHDFVDSYAHRDLLLKTGLDITNTLLLYGPPGCGKTTVAQYISSVTGLPLVTARLDGLVSSLLGSTAKNIRKIFDYASKRECILFLDEFDVIAKLRDDKNELGELKRVVNSLLQNIDGFNNDSILIAATNHHELLDPAIWRRFSTIVALEKPQGYEIDSYLKVLLADKPTNFLSSEKKTERIVAALTGLSYSDIRTVIFNALKTVVLSGRECLTNCDVLKSVYLYSNHAVEHEDDFIAFLLGNGVTHKEANVFLEIPLRKIQSISKALERKEP